jgi:hypothetical protein
MKLAIFCLHTHVIFKNIRSFYGIKNKLKNV